LLVNSKKYALKDTENLFASFLSTYNKSYDGQEYINRLNIFAQNLIIAEKYDLESRNTDPSPFARSSAEYGITQFMDLSPDEFKSQYLTSEPSSMFLNVSELSFTANETLVEENLKDDIFDWGQRGKTTPVYNQGSCGSCWAFSVTEQLESMWAIAGHPLEHLSMQQLVDCDRRISRGCAGGNVGDAWNYLHSVGGQDSYESYPYVGRDEPCHFNHAHIAARFRSWGWITRTRDEHVMRKYLLGVGPISVCVDAHQWQYYRNGIVRSCGRSIDHCVQITGWDNTYEAWVVRNSWGKHWGNEGYIAIAAFGNVCAIADDPSSVEI